MQNEYAQVAQKPPPDADRPTELKWWSAPLDSVKQRISGLNQTGASDGFKFLNVGVASTFKSCSTSSIAARRVLDSTPPHSMLLTVSRTLGHPTPCSGIYRPHTIIQPTQGNKWPLHHHREHNAASDRLSLTNISTQYKHIFVSL